MEEQSTQSKLDIPLRKDFGSGFSQDQGTVNGNRTSMQLTFKMDMRLQRSMNKTYVLRNTCKFRMPVADQFTSFAVFLNLPREFQPLAILIQ